MALAGSAGGRITAGVGANLIGMHASDRNQDATCYVGNLDPQVTEELVWELFVQGGPVVNVYLPKDRVTNLHQGYGFVEFRSEEDADYAIKILNMVKMYGKPIRVNKASTDKNSQDVGANLFIGNLDPDVDEKLLYDTFSAFGVVVNTPKIMRDPESGVSKGFGFISFDSFEASDAVIEAMNGQFLMNRAITVSYAFKKDTKGERHGTPAERLLAAQRRAKAAATSRPHTMFATGPRQAQQAGAEEQRQPHAAVAASGFAAGGPMPPPPAMPAPGMSGPLPGMAPPPPYMQPPPPMHMGGAPPPPWAAPGGMPPPPPPGYGRPPMAPPPWAAPGGGMPPPPPGPHGGYGGPPGGPPPPGMPPPPRGFPPQGMPPPPPPGYGGFHGGPPGMPPPPPMGFGGPPRPPHMPPPPPQGMPPPPGPPPAAPDGLPPPPPPPAAGAPPPPPPPGAPGPPPPPPPPQ